MAFTHYLVIINTWQVTSIRAPITDQICNKAALMDMIKMHQIQFHVTELKAITCFLSFNNA